MSNKQEEKKITGGKPVSLSPLSFKEALAAFLKVKRASKEEMDKAIKEDEAKKEKSSD